MNIFWKLNSQYYSPNNNFELQGHICLCISFFSIKLKILSIFLIHFIYFLYSYTLDESSFDLPASEYDNTEDDILVCQQHNYRH